MVRKVKTVVKSEAISIFSSHEENVKWKELDPAELAKIQSMCKDVAWKTHECKPEVAKAATLLTACQETITWKGRGEMRPEAATFLTSCKEAVCQETISPVSTSEVHVLAVDDSILDRKVIEKLLKTSSYKVTTVDSATRALEVLGLSDGRPSLKPNTFQVNLIITDYCMPEMTGYDLLKRVKAQTSALKDVPVVVMSSENDTTRIERCLAEGAEEFIIKPVQLADVKRLRGHIRPLSRSSSSGSGESSSSSSSIGAKRKIGSPEGLQVNTSPERRPRLSRVIVA